MSLPTTINAGDLGHIGDHEEIDADLIDLLNHVGATDSTDPDSLDFILKSQLKGGPFRSLRYYGVLGDATDEATGWQEAIDDNRGTGRILIVGPPEGDHYALGSGLVSTAGNGGLRIMGTGVANSYATGTQPRVVFTPTTGNLLRYEGSGLYVGGLNLDYSNVLYADNLLRIDSATGSSAITIENNLIGGSNVAARLARSLISMNRVQSVLIRGNKFSYCAIAIHGVDGNFCNGVRVSANTFGNNLIGTAGIKNAGQAWMIDNNIVQPLFGGAVGFYVQDYASAYGLAFVNNWLGDGGATGTWLSGIDAFGFEWSGGRVEGGNTWIDFTACRGGVIKGVTPASTNGINWSGASNQRSCVVEGVNWELCTTPYVNKTNLSVRHFKGNYPNTYNEEAP